MKVEDITKYCMEKQCVTEEYPYYCPSVQQPYWNTIYLDDFPDEELLNMIDLAHDTVFSKFSKKEQKFFETCGQARIHEKNHII